MKVGSMVVAAHVLAVGVFCLTQGCVTTEQSTTRHPAARHKSPWRYRGRSQKVAKQIEDQPVQGVNQGGAGQLINPIFVDPVVEETIMAEETAPPSAITPIAPPPRKTYTPTTGTYIVQKGDTISHIAVKYHSTTKELVALNNLSNPDRLYIGQQIKVPGGARPTYSAPASYNRPARTVMKGEKYVIQKGDTLSHIAVRFGVSINDLRAVNNLSSDFIRAGETLTIPKHGKLQEQKKAVEVKPQPAKEPVVEEVPPPEPLEVTEPVTIDPRVTNVTAVEEKIIYPGETLDDIARQYGVSKNEIMRLNNISDETSIQEGQRIRIPIAE